MHELMKVGQRLRHREFYGKATFRIMSIGKKFVVIKYDHYSMHGMQTRYTLKDFDTWLIVQKFVKVEE